MLDNQQNYAIEREEVENAVKKMKNEINKQKIELETDIFFNEDNEVNKQNSDIENIGVIDIFNHVAKQMSCPRKLVHACGTIALVIFLCLEEKMDYFRQYDNAVRDFVGNIYDVLTPLLAMLFGALALVVTFGTNSSKFRSQQGKEKKVPLMKAIANFVVSISLHTLALMVV